MTDTLDAFGSPKRRFSVIEEVNKNASCGTIAKFFLRSSSLIFLTSISSKNSCPSGISIVLPSAFASVVLPQPTGPTIAISSPGYILKLRRFSELNFEPGYLMVNPLASNKPIIFYLKNIVFAPSTIFALF